MLIKNRGAVLAVLALVALAIARVGRRRSEPIKSLNAEPDDRETYYRAVLAALERLLAENGSVTPAELHEREH
jgi:hypothetical protein